MKRRSWLVALLVLLWLGLLGVGEGLLSAYKITPGERGDAPETWPADSRLPRRADRSTLVVFVHPYCPCTRATLGELALLLASCKDPVKVHVVFVRPSGLPDAGGPSDLRQSAASLPGVQVWTDPDGSEARRFRAATSGLTLLYNTAGHLRFRGGITRARGHTGDNPGREALDTLLRKGRAGLTETAVFGCPLFER
jgi:hypothetical protein